MVPNLMIGFGIDQTQAEYVADIKLRNINKEYILRRIEEISSGGGDRRPAGPGERPPPYSKKVIVSELQAVKKKYCPAPPHQIVYDFSSEAQIDPEEEIPDYPVHVFLSREGYFKKITPQSLRMSGEQKYKEGDGPFLQWEGSNRDEFLVFTDRQQCYKSRLSDFGDTKASVLGEYLPTRLGMDQGENPIWACITGDYSGHLLFFFENGKVARVELAAYKTQTRRRRLTGAYSDKSPLAAALLLHEDRELALFSTEGRCLIFHSSVLSPKATRSTQGVGVMTLKPKYHLESVRPLEETSIVNLSRYRARALPAAGALLKEEDRGEEQLSLL